MLKAGSQVFLSVLGAVNDLCEWVASSFVVEHSVVGMNYSASVTDR